MKDVYLLAIESSCDETAASVVKNGDTIVSSIVSSQIDVHKRFGGVVPEVASRIHVENVSWVIREAMEQADMKYSDLDGICVTQGPGLIGSLHVGVQAAKTLAYVHDLPLIPVHHISGHIYANQFVDPITYPMLALVVSGGHTELVWMKEEYSFEIIGTTQDDAVGEAYDKVARVLGLPYPGGPQIDRLAKEGTNRYPLPKPHTENPTDFSFSGLKSAVIQSLQRLERRNEELNKADMACSFQEAALGELWNRVEYALNEYKPAHFVIAGGVAANSRLRQLITENMKAYPDITYTIPPLKYCTDNAAMIGASGYHAYTKGIFASEDLGAKPSLDLEQVGKF
ncbi:MAG: tRNA (adenosine(37)-N6)-threonylcarbamoyltransferase complex transferase subunit TsaD [Erysipelotrichaceae bacterium]|nr:tRNA (adenosine(37)-N6)-threonylcarbamoyltransferase complex transferase subunit TsaD [Erysipelotrichaceae bacterium]